MCRNLNHEVTTLSAVLSIIHHPIVAVNVPIETVNRRLPISEVVAHKDLGGDNQLFPHQHLLQTAAGNMFLEGMQ
jgi:hypothetical protein